MRFVAILLLAGASAVYSDEARPRLSFGFVPQQSASTLANQWTPILAYLGRETGIELAFRTAPDIPEFERRVAAGKYDLAYVNPYHYAVFSRDPGYRGFARERGKQLRGILVVRRESPITDVAQLDGATLAFPAPAAFAASLLVQANLSALGIAFEPRYVSSHDSVYRSVALGLYPAGGGIERTFASVDPEVSRALRILWRSAGFTPHAFAAHPRVDPAVVQSLTAAMERMTDSEEGNALLKAVEFNGIDPARDADWDDIRQLGIHRSVGLEE
jgi:phosphonate transport system substrate-binding protein